MRSYPITGIFLALSLFTLRPLGLEAQTGGPRYALVIGNSDYSGMPRLRNPANDAHDVAEVLGKLGFGVTPLYDGTRKQMNQAIIAFRESLASDRSSEGFFYYAGHGVQAKGVNYLIPVGSDIRSEADLDDEAVSLQRVLGSIEEARNRVNVVILDACRDNPLPAASRSAARGLAVVAAAPPESVVLFSTAQNQTAADGEGRNSPFAAALVKYLPESGDISRTVKLITAEVKRVTGAAQTPFQYTSLDFDYELNRGAPVAPVPASAVATTLTLTLSYGSLVVGAATGGNLYLDGKAMGEIPAGAEARLDNVEVGDRVVELRYAGGDKETKSVGVRKGQSSNVSFSWKKAAPRAPASSAPTTPAGMVLVPGGTYTMGSPPNEADRSDRNEDQHQVSLSDFYIGATEVTQGQYKAVMGGNPSNFKGDNLPVEQVSWYDAVAYCNKLSEKEGLSKVYTIDGTNVSANWNAKGYRLPTEAEWEYAAKGGRASSSLAINAVYAGSANINVAWYCDNSEDKTHPVGKKAANALGLYDMSGNVSEWCWDWHDPYGSPTGSTNPLGASSGGQRVIRGGDWNHDASSLRSSCRDSSPPAIRYYCLGFRLARRP